MVRIYKQFMQNFTQCANNKYVFSAVYYDQITPKASKQDYVHMCDQSNIVARSFFDCLINLVYNLNIKNMYMITVKR